jgi:hypothetical protein
LSTKIKDKEIAWRRSKIIELKAFGLNQAEIARELHVTEGTISLDMQYLREQAKQSIKEYTTELLPQQYQVCLSALKNTFIMMQTDDNREKLAALELFKDTHITKLELLANSTTIDQALEYIRSKQPRLESESESESETKKEDSAVF